MSSTRRSWGVFSAFAIAWNNDSNGSSWQQNRHPFSSTQPMSARRFCRQEPSDGLPNGRSGGAAQQSSRKRVVIVGGGFAGGTAAMLLQHSFEVTLVDRRPYFENITAQYRVLSDATMAPRNRLPHHQYAPAVNVEVGGVEQIRQTHVVLDDKRTIPFDYLVLATGSHCKSLPVLGNSDTSPIPVISLTDGIACEREQQRLASVRGGSVVIVGGGASGVEVAAELAEAYPDKTVHFAFSGTAPLSGMPEKAQSVAVKHFSKLCNVRMWPGERVIGVSSNDGSVVTRSGRTIADVSSVFLCVGFQPNTAFIKDEMSTLVDDHGYVKVNQHLQSTEQENIFAIGDVTNVKEAKLAQNAFRHASVAARNIMNLEKGTGCLSVYVPEERRVCIMLGRSNSVVVGPTGVNSGWWAAKRKQGFALSAGMLTASARMLASRA
mmetsp:Transcript_13663/g.54096  ORF Transcript_13663/g.54096 Transcript_13663/m.54096 type:complete len:435 (+) Transcript_13663:2-1306(+)